MAHVVWLEDCAAAGRDAVGGKAQGLGLLLGAGLQVPRGFAVTCDAYRSFVLGHGLGPAIDQTLLSANLVASAEAASHHIRALFEQAALATPLLREIAHAYEASGDGELVPVAVRSSATTE